MRERQFLTTTQAANLLEVSPDTVLKWVKNGRLRARRTLGGHHRIALAELEALLKQRESNTREASPPPLLYTEKRFRYCWDFLGEEKDGHREQCRECIVYRSRSKRCYELKNLPDGFGHRKVFCTGDCTSCSYYHIAYGRGLTVIVISEDEELRTQLALNQYKADFELYLAGGVYQGATLIEHHRPDFIVLDTSMGSKQIKELCHELSNDPRIPSVKLMLCSPSREKIPGCNQQVYAWLHRPFTVEELRGCLLGDG